MKARKIFEMTTGFALAVAFTMGAVGCGGDDGTNDSENEPLVMGISTPDEVFNPFFATSAYDTTIIGMTQIGMLTTDKEGGIVPRKDVDTSTGQTTYIEADNEPCVVKYWDSVYDESDTDGSLEYPGYTGTTTYQLAIKNGIQFSNGDPLTMKDVLFNLYTYLDPAYTGSATVYSTHIIGLNAYRTQNANATQGSSDAFDEAATAAADERVNELVDYVNFRGAYTGNDKVTDRWTEEQKASMLDDYLYTASEFKKELESYWGTAKDSIESYEKWEGFDEAWLIYLMDYGGDTELIQLRDDRKGYLKDEDGNCRIDPAIEADRRTSLNEYCAAHGLDANTEEGQRQFCIETVFGNYFPNYDPSNPDKLAGSGLTSNFPSNVEEVLNWWTTADTARSRFMAEYKRDQFKGTRAVPTVSGITTFTSDSIYGHSLGENCEILQIKIRGVDPKAIWNFSFQVAPLNYYSGTYQGKNYVEAFDASKGEFGVELGDFNFFQEVLNAPEKVRLPVGAGPYMASSADGDPATSGGDFFNMNYAYYQRNEYFHTVGSGIENAKIKYLRYRVVQTDQIVNSLNSGEILYGEPNATTDKMQELDNLGIEHVEAKTAGYGYVGINPRFVPDINVRRAIMKAMDTSIIFNNYYKGGLAESIVRPMTKVSWAYPSAAGVYETPSGLSYAYDSTGNEIRQLLEAAQYTYNAEDNSWSKDIPGFGTDTLDYKFTIAGGSTDHPAYAMFLNAQEILNRVGFNIKVVQSQTALSDLTTGKLTVWAAAWSSTVDPDMYQVYHMDSKATSVNNWGYPQILKNRELYSTEYDIVTELSGLIDEGRETDNQNQRKSIYARALDKIMELAVEFPTYQRSDMYAYNGDIIDSATLTPETEVGAYNGLFSRIWEVDYKH